jgi:hypothetical protein
MVAARKDKHRALIGVDLGEADLRLDAQAPHRRYGLRCESCGNYAVSAGLALKLGIVDAGDGKGGFPVCHRVEYEKVNIAAGHR